MIPRVYNLPDHTKGDTFEGFAMSIRVSGSLLDLTGASIVMNLRESPVDSTIKASYSVNSGIRIDTTVLGKFYFNTQIIDLHAKKYYYSIQVTTSTGNDYTITGASITYLSAPLTGEKIRVSYRK